jgi:hypothetical protein
MKRKESGTALLAIRLPLREMCPAEYQAGVAQMGIAKGYLEKAEKRVRQPPQRRHRLD